MDWEVLDPERRGVATVDAVRAWVAALDAKGVGEEEVSQHALSVTVVDSCLAA